MNSSTSRTMMRGVLPALRSVHRNWTWSPSNPIRRWLEMATRWVYRPRYFRTCSGLLGTTEGSFGVDDPSVNVKSPDPGSEPLGFG